MKRYVEYITAFLFIGLFASCEPAKYPIDDHPLVKIDTRLIGKWKVKGEKDEYILSKDGKSVNVDYKYLVLNKDPKTGKVDKFSAFLSEVGNAKFLNVFFKEDTIEGYIFLRILDINAAGTTARIATIADTTLKYITNATEMRERFTNRLNDPTFYNDTTYFYKIK